MISNMSQMNNESDQSKCDKRRKRATIATVYASTPVIQNAVTKQFHLSLSGISFLSSSSPSSSEANHMRTFFNKDRLRQINKTLSKEKKRAHAKRITQDSDSDWVTKRLTNKSLNEKEKRKQKLKNKKKTVKRKRVAQIEDTDNEWETRSEKSINELSTGSRSILNGNVYINLFDNPCTPEKIRDIPNMCTNLPESPIIGCSRRRINLISKRNVITMQDKSLPVNLLPIEIPETPNEDEIIIHNEDNAEIHISRRPEESQKQLEDLSHFMQFPTSCRGQTIKTYPKRRPRLELTSSFEQIKFPKVPRKKKSPIPPGMRCIAEYWDKALQKWVPKQYENSSTDSEYWDNNFQKWVPRRHEDSFPEKDFVNDKRKKKTSKRNTKKQKWKMSQFLLKQRYNVYDISDETDIEFETGGSNGKRLSFREFCYKRRMARVINTLSSS